jgi:hypothetical protein
VINSQRELGGLDDQQAGGEAVLLQVADAVVAPPLLGDVVQQFSQVRVAVVLILAGHRAYLPAAGGAAGASLGVRSNSWGLVAAEDEDVLVGDNPQRQPPGSGLADPVQLEERRSGHQPVAAEADQ